MMNFRKGGPKPRAQKKFGGQPSISRPLELYTKSGKRVFKRAFDAFGASVFLLTKKMEERRYKMYNVASLAYKVISSHLSRVDQEITAALQRYDDQMAELGINDLAEIDEEPLQETVRITSPLHNQFLMLIERYDQLLLRIDTLWIHGYIPQDNYRLIWRDHQRRILKVSGRFRIYSDRSRKFFKRVESSVIDDASISVFSEQMTEDLKRLLATAEPQSQADAAAKPETDHKPRKSRRRNHAGKKEKTPATACDSGVHGESDTGNAIDGFAITTTTGSVSRV
jgi:hypothetical protein